MTGRADAERIEVEKAEEKIRAEGTSAEAARRARTGGGSMRREEGQKAFERTRRPKTVKNTICRSQSKLQLSM